jgi:HEPN domain-containing protein
LSRRIVDWFQQAEVELQAARQAQEDGDYEYSCFAAEQAAENALKAVYQRYGLNIWEDTVSALIGNLPPAAGSPPETLRRYARLLDQHYVSTRFPEGFDSGEATDFFTRAEARTAIQYAEAILEFCRDQIV